ncbi:MAG: hypothetical protein K9L61_05930 [Candidatus Omnitrophica bacterium]|nr:hypothetical protein [Candidatus Omnitrophota bacterium]
MTPLRKINNYLNVLREFYRINKSAYKNSKNIDILKKNIELCNKYKGERIIIVQTGNSVDNIDFKFLKNEYVFGCNFLALHKSFDDLDINFYLDIDTWSYRLYYTYCWWFDILYTRTNPGTKIFASASSYEMIKDRRNFRKEDTHYLAFNSRFSDSSNISIKVDQMCNIVTQGSFSATICLSIFMGFKDIYLIGADYAKDPLVAGHFYDGVKSYTKPDNALVKNYRAINEFAKNKGVNIYNVVDDGFNSRVFSQIERDKFLELIQQKR